MDRFTKVKNIGKGNMGACTLVRNNDDGRHYVIKQVDLAKLNKKERQQSLNEAKVLSSLRHPNIINYVDSFLARKSDHLCIVMEFADGGDLSQKIKASHNTNFPQDQILDWAIQLALALQHIHSKKILHRDVKTQNVFLTSDGMCKLGDFGIARTLNNTFDQANTFVGTPYYLSPELILERPYDSQSDVWAFGVCLYEMMALKHPFNANDMKSLMQRILKVQYEPAPLCYSSELRSVVSRLLVKDPQQRMKLTEMLELPIMRQRMLQWLQGGIVPSRYISSLIRHKLLPASVMPAQAPEKQSSVASFPQVTQRPKQTSTIPQFTNADDERAVKREEIRSEFRDVRLKPKPPANPAPSRDPTIVNDGPAAAYAAQQRQAANPVHLPSLAGRPQALPEMPMRRNSGPTAAALKPPAYIPPMQSNAANANRAYNLPAPTGNQNIQQVLDKVPSNARGGGLQPIGGQAKPLGGGLPPINNNRW